MASFEGTPLTSEHFTNIAFAVSSNPWAMLTQPSLPDIFYEFEYEKQ